VVCADPAAPAVQALIRSDPPGFAERELAERIALALPPGATVATLTGPPAAVRSLLELTRLPAGTGVLGPVAHVPAGGAPGPGAGRGTGPAADAPADEVVRAVLRVACEHGYELARALREAAAVRSARREPGAVRVQIDPRDLG
jgi:primosomal protein N' (replication factor Y)